MVSIDNFRIRDEIMDKIRIRSPLLRETIAECLGTFVLVVSTAEPHFKSIGKFS